MQSTQWAIAVPLHSISVASSKFIDHARLKEVWCGLLGEPSLPADHYAVYKNITQYADVDRTKLYEDSVT